MYRAIAVYLFVSIGVVSCSFWQVSKADETPAEQVVDAALLTGQLIETFDLVLANHVSPPTMQQMVLESIAALYSRADADMPADLAKEISNTTGDSLRRILERELLKVGTEMTTLLDCVPAEFASIGVTVTPMKAQLVNDQLAANRYVGIGIAIQTSVGETKMAKVFPGGPAHQAGAQDGDVIIEVDGKSTEGVNLRDVIDLLRGVKGSKVELVARRNGTDQTLALTRDVIPLTTVRPALLTKSGKTAGIALERVSASSVHELRKINSSLDSKVETVVLDFRTNIGARNLHYGELLGNALIDNAAIGLVSDRNGKKREVRAEKGTLFSGRNLIAVIDTRTSGVLSWIAAALQDNGQAVIYGAPTAMSTTTETTLKLSDATHAISIPTHKLCYADGEPLTRRKFSTSREDFLVLQQRIDFGWKRGSKERLPGVLYPDKPFPDSGPRRLAAGVRNRPTTIVKIGPLIEPIERDTLFDQSPPVKNSDH